MLIKNLKYLREQKKISQHQLADIIGVSRSTYANYEKGKSEPTATSLLKIARYFKTTIDNLLTRNLGNSQLSFNKGKNSILTEDIRILTITTNASNKENVLFVPIKAIAGYALDRNTQAYINQLPKFYLPKLSEGTHRAFELEGKSMLPLQEGFIVIGKFVEHATFLKNGYRYIIVLRDKGIVFKKNYF